MRLFQLIVVPLLLCAPAVFPMVARAHGGEPAISTFPAEAAAGGELTVFGENLEADAAMELHLLTADGDLLVAEPTTDEAGHFSATLTLPETLPERTYELRLTEPSGGSTSTFVTIVGSDTGATDGTPVETSNSTSGLLIAAVLAVAGIGLVALSLRPTKAKGRTGG